MHAEPQQAALCASCHQPLAGKYCSECGEKVLHEHDRSIGHFFHEFFHMLTHWDGKFFKSLKLLFTRPGLLTQEYLAGRRTLYTTPLTLFLIANLIYLLYTPIDALNSFYSSQVYGQPYSRSVRGIVEQKMAERQWNESRMEENYNAKSAKISKLMVMLLVFMFSIPVALIFYDRRSYYFDHLMFSTEYICFIIYGLLLLVPIMVSTLTYVYAYAYAHLTRQSIHISLINNYTMLAGFLLLWLFLAVAAKRVYKQSWAYIIPKTLLLNVAFAGIMLLYRYLLFYATIFML